MIHWPTRLVPAATANLDRFKATSLARELEQDAHEWRFLSWAWTDELPVRLWLANEEGRSLAFTLDVGGLWTAQERETLPPTPRGG